MEDKDEYIGSLLLSLFLMQGEVDRLNQTLDLAKKGELVYINNPQIDKLKAENERLKEKFEIESLTDKTTGETIYRSNVVNKLKELLELRIEDLCESCRASSMMPMPCTVYKQTLQEIKAIAEAPKPFIDFSVTKTATEVEYDYAAICNELELKLHKVLELITKVEEE